MDLHDQLIFNIYLLTLFSQLVKLKTHPLIYRTMKFLVMVQMIFLVVALRSVTFESSQTIFLVVKLVPLLFVFYILVQTEFRLVLRALKLDRFLGRRFTEEDQDELIETIDALIDRKLGALITLERNDSLKEYMHNASMIQAPINKDLIISIFITKSPLHDGAVIIKDRLLVCAGAYYPTSESTSVPKALGSRHRAALGISEITDAFTIIVSEETGNVSVTLNGKLDQDISRESLMLYLKKYFNQ